MSTHYENHQLTAELNDPAAHAHRSAAEQPGKQDHQSGPEHSRQAMEHSQRAYLNAQEPRHPNANEHGIVPFGHEAIAIRAYELWLARGCPEGSPEEDWFHAAEQLRSHK